MSETATTAMEISFNILYLVAIYFLVVVMARKYRAARYHAKSIAGSFLLAFLLLAVGDTGHVGFRVAAYALGGLENNAVLVGLGALATAVTVTVFYMLMAKVWYDQGDQTSTGTYRTLLVLGAARLIFMALPDNNWGQIVPPLVFSYIRNSFLTIMGLWIAWLFLRSTVQVTFSKAAAVCILISFGFYMPVILFIRSVPMLGMLMIPKTLAYVALAIIGNKMLFRSAADLEAERVA